MSITSSVQLAANALRAQQIGMQVVGQNIANANTPGYIREEVNFVPAPTQRHGGLLLGLGVQVDSIQQKIDLFLEGRLHGATSDRASTDQQEQTYLQLEALLGSLGENDLGSSLNNFFGAIGEILNQPESISVRNLAVLQGRTLAADINRIDSRVRQLRSDANDRIISIAGDINRLTDEIRTLNVRIAQAEGGNASKSQAVGLRDQRLVAVTKLSELIDLQAIEQSSGAVNIFVGGEFLVFEGNVREVEIQLGTDRGLSVAQVQIAETNSPLQVTSGELAGWSISRDEILGHFIDDLDRFAATFAFEFNRIFSSGQGLKGYQELTSSFAVNAANLPLDAAGLPFTPVNGSFEVQLFNATSGLTETTEVFVDLSGLNADTTLSSLASQINAIEGITATVGSDRRLQIKGDASNHQIAFANDTSGILAALGLNVFFTGSSASDVGVAQQLIDDPAKFAASGVGISSDTTIGTELANFLERPLESANGESLGIVLSRITGGVTQASATTRAVADGFRVFEQTLQGQKLAISGVSLDEETVRLMQYQRSFQASARYIQTLDELLGLMVSL